MAKKALMCILLSHTSRKIKQKEKKWSCLTFRRSWLSWFPLTLSWLFRFSAHTDVSWTKPIQIILSVPKNLYSSGKNKQENSKDVSAADTHVTSKHRSDRGGSQSVSIAVTFTHNLNSAITPVSHILVADASTLCESESTYSVSEW